MRGRVDIGKSEEWDAGLESLKEALKPLEQLCDCWLLQKLCSEQFTVTPVTHGF